MPQRNDNNAFNIISIHFWNQLFQNVFLIQKTGRKRLYLYLGNRWSTLFCFSASQIIIYLFSDHGLYQLFAKYRVSVEPPKITVLWKLISKSHQSHSHLIIQEAWKGDIWSVLKDMSQFLRLGHSFPIAAVCIISN